METKKMLQLVTLLLTAVIIMAAGIGIYHFTREPEPEEISVEEPQPTAVPAGADEPAQPEESGTAQNVSDGFLLKEA